MSFVSRNEKVNYMKVGVGETYKRMKNFTALSEEKNPEEYSRKYVDEAFETTDVIGISSSISFALDQKIGDDVHDVIVSIFNEEKLGSDAVVTVLSVDFTKKVDLDALETGVGYAARLRTFSVIPESEGGSAEAYTYEGTFKANGATQLGKAIFTEELPITSQVECTFKAE